jgi:hypothetical protein
MFAKRSTMKKGKCITGGFIQTARWNTFALATDS